MPFQTLIGELKLQKQGWRIECGSEVIPVSENSVLWLWNHPHTLTRYYGGNCLSTQKAVLEALVEDGRVTKILGGVVFIHRWMSCFGTWNRTLGSDLAPVKAVIRYRKDPDVVQVVCNGENLGIEVDPLILIYLLEGAETYPCSLLGYKTGFDIVLDMVDHSLVVSNGRSQQETYEGLFGDRPPLPLNWL